MRRPAPPGLLLRELPVPRIFHGEADLFISFADRLENTRLKREGRAWKRIEGRNGWLARGDKLEKLPNKRDGVANKSATAFGCKSSRKLRWPSAGALRLAAKKNEGSSVRGRSVRDALNTIHTLYLRNESARGADKF